MRLQAEHRASVHMLVAANAAEAAKTLQACVFRAMAEYTEAELAAKRRQRVTVGVFEMPRSQREVSGTRVPREVGDANLLVRFLCLEYIYIYIYVL